MLMPPLSTSHHVLCKTAFDTLSATFILAIRPQIAAHQPFLSKKNYAYWVGRVAYWDVHERDRQRCVQQRAELLHANQGRPCAINLYTCLLALRALLR